MSAGNIDDLRIMHQLDEILLHFSREEVLIRQDKKNFARKCRKVSFGHGLLVHEVSEQSGDMHILLPLVVLEDGLKHIPCAGNFFFCT